MPIDLKRRKIENKLNRLTYRKGLNIKEDTEEFLAKSVCGFTADEIVAKIDTAANAVAVESVLSRHPDLFEYAKKDGKIYWYMTDENADDVLKKS